MINRHFQPHPVWSSQKSPWCGGLIAALLAAPALTRAGQVTLTAATIRSSGLGEERSGGVQTLDTGEDPRLSALSYLPANTGTAPISGDTEPGGHYS